MQARAGLKTNLQRKKWGRFKANNLEKTKYTRAGTGLEYSDYDVLMRQTLPRAHKLELIPAPALMKNKLETENENTKGKFENEQQQQKLDKIGQTHCFKVRHFEKH